MIIDKGLHVKCFMRVGAMVLEGIVEDWSDGQVILKSISDQSLLIIHRPAEDIVLTKVVLEEPLEIPAEKEVREPPTNPRQHQATRLQEQIKGKLQEALQPSGDVDLDKLNVKELRNLVLEQEKQIIAQKQKQHFGSGNLLNYNPKLSNTPISAMKPKPPKR
jgi:hypothetical protein